MELKIEAKNLDMRKTWQEKIEGERDKLIRHYAGHVLHLRVTIEATPGYKEGDTKFDWSPPFPTIQLW